MRQHCTINAPSLQSIALKHDYGRLLQIPVLSEAPLSDVERMLLLPIHLYHVVIKVAIRTGCASTSTSELKGNVIYFPHEGPTEVIKSLARAATVKERVEWLSCDLRIMLVGPENNVTFLRLTCANKSSSLCVPTSSSTS